MWPKVKGQRSGVKWQENVPFLGQIRSHELGMRSFGTGEGQVGYFWQHAKYFLAYCQILQDNRGHPLERLPSVGRLPLWVARCQISVKSPRPKHRAIARCEVLIIYITYISVSIPTPWAVAGPHGQLASLQSSETETCIHSKMNKAALWESDLKEMHYCASISFHYT